MFDIDDALKTIKDYFGMFDIHGALKAICKYCFLMNHFSVLYE